MSKLVIQKAVVADAEAIRVVRNNAWLASVDPASGITSEDVRVHLEGREGELIPEQIEKWRKYIAFQEGKRVTFVAWMDGKIVGFVSPRKAKGQRRIGALYVASEAQGHGIGTKLLRKAIDWWGRDEDIHLHVIRYNHRAVNLYERLGFEKTGGEMVLAALPNGKQLPGIEMVLRTKTK